MVLASQAAARHAAAIAHSPLGMLLQASCDYLFLVVDAIPESDALSLALVCTALRDSVFARFTPLPLGHQYAPRRIRTLFQDVVVSVKRLKWALAVGCPRKKELCKWAAEGGHRVTLKLLHEIGCPWDGTAVLRRPHPVICPCSSGSVANSAPGVSRPARMRLALVTCQRCDGRFRRGVVSTTS